MNFIVDALGRRTENLAENPEDVSNVALTDRRACKVFPDIEEDDHTANSLNDTQEMQQSGLIVHQTLDENNELLCLGLQDSSSLPKSAHVFLYAIRRNRSYQKFLQSKLAQIEVRIEENKKLKERVKFLRDFQVSCRKLTGRALAQGKDPRIQLISARRIVSSKDSKINDKKVSAVYDGPVENAQVVNYREAFKDYPLTLKNKKWTHEEKENLKKGIRQQFQEMVLQFSVDQLSGSEGSLGYVTDWDKILPSIRDLEITPERCREFLPKVNWDQLASLYVVNRTCAECEAQWLNSEDPLVNHGKWTPEEDKKLLFIVQKKRLTNWFDISVSLGRNRTPFQCLARFQRSLHAGIIRSDWTKEEDAQLHIAVETFGENDWQAVASILKGRTGTQCSNRWKKTLDPSIVRKGTWTLDESKRLKVAVMLFGPKNWNKIAQFVPGRTGAKCRERWVNCLDPFLKKTGWTEEEDSRLKAAVEECGHSWAKVAKYLVPRTDSECSRRWKTLFPHEVYLLQEARKTLKAALISNFVDRESERPALGPCDFVPLRMIESASEPKNMNKSRKPKRKASSSKRHRFKEGLHVEDLRRDDDTEVSENIIQCYANDGTSGEENHMLSLGHLDPNVIAVTNSELDDAVGQCQISKLPLQSANSVLSSKDNKACNVTSKVRSNDCSTSKTNNDEDNVTLASFIASVSRRRKRSKVGSESYSNNNDDNDTLVSFLQNKSKKKTKLSNC
ncbi:uncharacterized protein LOC126659970 isoform X2 [Mercurialis annua]|uniref:uncharacterized protein LOC126659970 isoform X2 n=1 Tax=Mercurialis annua TaxID=3986 RepID=UPI002160F07A|nr:uncharacterized protein LOC126659970 isoform X2 [Mercurialis annua]